MLEESRQATVTASSEAQRELSAVSHAGLACASEGAVKENGKLPPEAANNVELDAKTNVSARCRDTHGRGSGVPKSRFRSQPFNKLKTTPTRYPAPPKAKPRTSDASKVPTPP